MRWRTLLAYVDNQLPLCYLETPLSEHKHVPIASLFKLAWNQSWRVGLFWSYSRPNGHIIANVIIIQDTLFTYLCVALESSQYHGIVWRLLVKMHHLHVFLLFLFTSIGRQCTLKYNQTIFTYALILFLMRNLHHTCMSEFWWPSFDRPHREFYKSHQIKQIEIYIVLVWYLSRFYKREDYFFFLDCLQCVRTCHNL